MYDFTVAMAIADFAPVLLFAAAAVLMLRDFYEELSKSGFSLLSAGVINVFAAGFLKAVWKLLYALGICDFHALNTMFLPLQSIGFLMAGFAMLMLMSKRRNAAMMLAPPLFKGSVVFLSMMVIGLGCMCTSLAVRAAKCGRKIAAFFFIMAFVFSMGMGYAGSLDPALAWVNWFEESVNTVSQACMLAGMIIIHKGEKRV